VPIEVGQRRFLIAFALLAMSGLALATPARSVPGSLDQTFSGDGKVRVRTDHMDEAHDMALDPQGRIVLVGTIWSGPLDQPRVEVIRLTPAGALDTSFSSDGRRTIRFRRGWSVGNDVAIQADGRIVVVGHWLDTSGTGVARMEIARLLPGGRFDSSFSGDGRREVDFRYTRQDAAESVVIQGDGKILVGGEADERAALVRLRPSGRLDRTFGTRGRVLTAPTGERFESLALQPDGRILGANYPLVRYLANGRPDPSFGDGGEAIDPAGPQSWGCTDIALQKNGKILCSSHFNNYEVSSQSSDAAVVRWTPDGHPDASFGSDGVIITGIEPSPGPQQSGSQEEAYSVAVQSDGKILTAGTTYSYATTGPYAGDSFLVIRYRSSGELDSSFDDGGIVRTQFTRWNDDRACCVELERTGKVVVGGTALNSDMAVARYLP
jgi:uncharacterized delta-60 repeat protein